MCIVEMAASLPSSGGKPLEKEKNMHNPIVATIITSSPAAMVIKDGGTKAVATNRMGSDENHQLAIGPKQISSSHGESSPPKTQQTKQISEQTFSGNEKLLLRHMTGDKTMAPILAPERYLNMQEHTTEELAAPGSRDNATTNSPTHLSAQGKSISPLNQLEFNYQPAIQPPQKIWNAIFIH